MADTPNTSANNLHLPVMLAIMDGFGMAPSGPGNAISLADTPYLDTLFADCPHTLLHASGGEVGLPDGQMGNSEVGHMNIGAGRVVYQDLSRINNACLDNGLATRPAIARAFRTAVDASSTLHLMGLLSDGGVHSSIDHLFALIDAAAAFGVSRIRVHCFMDGRDVSPTSGKGFIEALSNRMTDAARTTGADVRIASIEGRFYAMDRDNRWDRVQRAYQAIADAQPLTQSAPEAYVAASYEAECTDEFIEPAAFCPEGITDDDSVIFFNFRPDRAREITRCFTQRDFSAFDRGAAVYPYFVCMTVYDETIDADVAFDVEYPEQTLADVVAQAGLKQYHIAETEKYAHVTFFLNGGREQKKPGETRVLIPSPKVATYDLQPQMSEPEVADTLARDIADDAADVYIVNFANCDMVGHTGSIPAAIQAVQAVDEGIHKVTQAVIDKGGCVLITADHGNADKMIDDDGSPFTAHTTALVPLVLVDGSGRSLGLEQRTGALCDIAPTLLDIMGLGQPTQMTGKSLLVK